MTREEEIAVKISGIRNVLRDGAALRLRGTDWFAWITAGASNTVLIAAEIGIAEILLTSNEAWVLTNEIEAQRLIDEELTKNFSVHAARWAYPEELEEFVRDTVGPRVLFSDRPVTGEYSLPTELYWQKRNLLPSEIVRYTQVGKLASQAMTEAMGAAQPDWTEWDLAGEGARALWKRGLHPTLTLVAGERRLPLYRHATASHEPLGKIAMLVFCARGFGLYANLTRFVSFGELPVERARLHADLREIEADALERCRPGTPLNSIYQTLDHAYRAHGYPQAISQHHQGGTTGYLSREIVATPATADKLGDAMSVAWNPSVTGAKIEDTFLITANAPQCLTYDENWPSTIVRGIARPLVLEK